MPAGAHVWAPIAVGIPNLPIDDTDARYSVEWDERARRYTLYVPLAVRGAVLVRVSGTLAPQAAGPPGSTVAPSLAKALGAPSPRPLRVLWSLLRQEVSRRTDTPHAPARRRARLGYGAHEQNDALLEQAAQAESHMAFFLSAGGTNIGVMFVIVAIVMSLWVLTSALHSL